MSDLSMSNGDEEAETMVVDLREEPHDIYIGRPSVFGNPIKPGRVCFECGCVHRRPGDTIACYESYARKKMLLDPGFSQAIRMLYGKRLGCFCAPAPCHGNVLKKLAEELS